MSTPQNLSLYEAIEYWTDGKLWEELMAVCPSHNDRIGNLSNVTRFDREGLPYFFDRPPSEQNEHYFNEINVRKLCAMVVHAFQEKLRNGSLIISGVYAASGQRLAVDALLSASLHIDFRNNALFSSNQRFDAVLISTVENAAESRDRELVELAGFYAKQFQVAQDNGKDDPTTAKLLDLAEEHFGKRPSQILSRLALKSLGRTRGRPRKRISRK